LNENLGGIVEADETFFGLSFNPNSDVGGDEMAQDAEPG